MLRGRFIAIQAYLKKQEKNQINNLTLHLKQLEKEEMKNPRVTVYETAKETLMYRTDKPLAKLIKKKRENQITKLEMKMEKSQQTTQKYKGS